MTRRVAAVAALTTLAILAGCSGLVGQTGPTETVTPASVPAVDETTDTPGGPLPPGLSGGGVVDADRLADAHLAAIRGQSYTWDARTTFDGNSSDQRLAVEAPKRYTYEQTSPGSGANTSEFADGEVVYVRYYRFVEQLRRVEAPNATARYGPIAASAIEQFLAVENATVAETLVDGDLYYRIDAESDRYRRIDGARNYSVTALVRPDGFVRELSASYDVVSDEDVIAVAYRYRYDTTKTTVEEPAWRDGGTTSPTSTPTPASNP